MGWQDDAIVPSTWHDDPIVDEKKKPEQSATQAALISGGHWLDSKAAGLREAVRSLPKIGEPIANALDSIDRLTGARTPDAANYRNGSVDAAMAPLREAHPVASFMGDFVPSAMTVNPLAMAGMGALDPGTAGERLGNAGLAYAGGKAGQLAGKGLALAGGKVADALSKRAANKAAERALQMGSKDATQAEAQAAGLVFPPDQINPSFLNRALGGLSGKIPTEQSASIKNESGLIALAKKDIGLPDDVPLTKETLSQVRSTAGEAYKTLKEFGPLNNQDGGLGKEMQGLTSEYHSLLQDFPSMRNAKIDALVKDLDKPQFNSSSAVELVKRLRKDGRSNLKAFDDPEKAALGKIQVGAAHAVENLMERNLEASGNGDFLQVFRNARTTIAKTHTIEDALEESTGKIVAGKIGKAYAKGAPLTGGLETIGKVAQSFPKSVQNVNRAPPGVSPLDYMAGLIGVGSGAGAAAGGLPFLRPFVRAGILSGPYQRAMAGGHDAGPGPTAALLAYLAKHPEELQKLGGLLGQGGLRSYQ